MRLCDAVAREGSPYERAWKRSERTGTPAIYFARGRWWVARAPGLWSGYFAALEWVEGR